MAKGVAGTHPLPLRAGGGQGGQVLEVPPLEVPPLGPGGDHSDCKEMVQGGTGQIPGSPVCPLVFMLTLGWGSRTQGLQDPEAEVLPVQCLAAEGCRGAVTPRAQGPGPAAEEYAKPDAPLRGPGVGLGSCQPLPQREDKKLPETGR